VLKPVVKEADLEPDTQKAFQMMKGPYKEAYKLGFAMGFLPKVEASVTSISRSWPRRPRPSIPGSRRFYW
jgi:hypothetical protein